uniref:Carboxylesterase type B domain-containing protein n=1 Tax=Cyprinus carpio TaxID=7962 RepID=A0A8C2ADV1_CYPCA
MRELAALLRSVSSAALISGPQIAAAGPKLLTKDGLIQGLTLDKSYVFYGIPFADPPVVASRWKPPCPVTPWRGVYDATYPRQKLLGSIKI